MKQKIIFYKQKKLSQNIKFKLRRDLLGINQKSNFARYSYKIDGVLDKIPNYRPIDSTIIIEEKDLKIILDILIKYDTDFEVFDINIPKTKFNK